LAPGVEKNGDGAEGLPTITITTPRSAELTAIGEEPVAPARETGGKDSQPSLAESHGGEEQREGEVVEEGQQEIQHEKQVLGFLGLPELQEVLDAPISPSRRSSFSSTAGSSAAGEEFSFKKRFSGGFKIPDWISQGWQSNTRSSLSSTTHRSTSGSRQSVQGAAGRCRGVLEWTVRSQDAPGKTSPRWAGPCLFQIDILASGRSAFRVTLPFRPVGQEGEALSIPLLAISAVREDKQDPLGLIFMIRYKAASERVEVLFRAATRESRASWVSGLCEAIHDSRSHVKKAEELRPRYNKPAEKALKEESF